jgi:hypothetical protein
MSRIPEAPQAAEGASLQCPLPGCPGGLPEHLADELAVCPVCRRLAARCPRLGREGRCPTLNRCLARYCRHCRQELAAGWAQALWARDLGPRRVAGLMGQAVTIPLKLEPTLQRPELAQRVLCLDRHAQCDRWDYRPLPLREAGGRIWVGTPDGRSLFVEPFQDPTQTSPVVSEPLWPGSGRARLRARSSGVWLVVCSEEGIKAINLLALDDSAAESSPLLDLWEPGPGERLLADPVLLRDSRNGLERVAVWLSGGPEGVTLWAAPLLVTYGRLPAPRRYAPQESGQAFPLGGDGALVLIPAALNGRDAAIVAGPHGLWLLDPAGEARGAASPTGSPSGDGRRPLEARLLLGGRQFLVGGGETPGVVFLAGVGGDPAGRDEACGTVFVAAGAGRGGAEELCAAVVARQGTAGPAAHAGPGCIPLDEVALGRGRGLLGRAGRSLVLHSALGEQHRLATSDSLPWILRTHAYGRVAVCSGRDAGEGRGRWFVQLWDLEDDDTLIDQAVWPHLPAHPLLLGRYLFTIEALGEPGRQALWLTRREFGET